MLKPRHHKILERTKCVSQEMEQQFEWFRKLEPIEQFKLAYQIACYRKKGKWSTFQVILIVMFALLVLK